MHGQGQLTPKLPGQNQTLYLAFVELEKAFDKVLRRMLWWAKRVVGVPEWIVVIV